MLQYAIFPLAKPEQDSTLSTTSMKKSSLSLTKALCAAMKRQSPPQMFSFLQEIFTPKELELVEKRLQIALKLEEGLPYSKIQQELKVSAATVAGVSEQRKGLEFAKLVLAVQKELTRFQWLRKRLNNPRP